jgi:hypothetical protein
VATVYLLQSFVLAAPAKGGGIKDLLTGLLGDAQTLLITTTAVMAVWFVIWSWVRTRSVVPTLGALLLGAVVLWGVNNVGGLRNTVEKDIKEHGGPTGGDTGIRE